MINLLKAEWRKIFNNRLLMCCLIWIWPALACAAIGIFSIVLLLNNEARNDAEPFLWTEVALGPWQLLNNPLGRLMLMGFAVTVFAGEYQNQTWKTILPSNRRLVILITKYIAMGSFIVIAFTLMMVLVVIGFGIINMIVGFGYPPDLTGEVLQEFLGDLALNASMTFISMLIVASIAILVALFTRSILIGMIAGVFFSILEFLGLPLLLLLAANILRQEWIFDFVRYLPSFNIENIVLWVNTDTTITNYLEEGVSASIEFSVTMIMIWLFGLIGLSMFIFQRQDIQ